MRVRSGPAFPRKVEPSDVRAMRKMSDAPSVAETAVSVPPSSQPNRKPPMIVRSEAPGKDSATALT